MSETTSSVHAGTQAPRWTLEDFIREYAHAYPGNNTDFVRRWAGFHFANFVANGTIPDFMRHV